MRLIGFTFALLSCGCQLGYDADAVRAFYHLTPPPGAVVDRPAQAPAGELPKAPATRAAVPPAKAVPKEPAVIGDSCRGRAGLCLGVKYVAFADERGPVFGEKEAADIVRRASLLWRDCGIEFQLDEYRAEKPEEHSLRFHTRAYSELSRMRRDFDDGRTLLVVATGSWDRGGPMGSTGANAWTTMPGDPLHGVVVERPAGDDVNVVAHELGHYLSLDHVGDASNMMNPVVYRRSTRLEAEQCESARRAAARYWKKMLRR